MAWFDSSITQHDLEELDEEFKKKYGKVKSVKREQDIPFEKDADLEEETQIMKDSVEDFDYDESAEQETIQHES